MHVARGTVQRGRRAGGHDALAVARVDLNGNYAVTWALAQMWREQEWRTSIRLLEAYALRFATYEELAEFANHKPLPSLSGAPWTKHMVRDRITKARDELGERIAKCERILVHMNGFAPRGEVFF